MTFISSAELDKRMSAYKKYVKFMEARFGKSSVAPISIWWRGEQANKKAVGIINKALRGSL